MLTEFLFYNCGMSLQKDATVFFDKIRERSEKKLNPMIQ